MYIPTKNAVYFKQSMNFLVLGQLLVLLIQMLAQSITNYQSPWENKHARKSQLKH